ncbi:hypothetical protein ACFWY5_29920 [Nonomuraea sp. NPDC059007]|uniref:phage terminase small subunit n=1 Tax=Nonomuraea sp. NPDC059007 TaxID=3346692 RepID=UPI00368581FB
MLAPLVEAYWEEPKPSILAEIRLNEERLGATIRDRQALRMNITNEPGPKAGEVPTLPDENVVDMELFRELNEAG